MCAPLRYARPAAARKDFLLLLTHPSGFACARLQGGLNSLRAYRRFSNAAMIACQPLSQSWPVVAEAREKSNSPERPLVLEGKWKNTFSGYQTAKDRVSRTTMANTMDVKTAIRNGDVDTLRRLLIEDSSRANAL